MASERASASELTSIRVAGAIDHKGTTPRYFVLRSGRCMCGDIVDGVSIGFDTTGDGCVIDFVQLGAFVDAERARRERTIEEAFGKAFGKEKESGK